MMPRKLSLSFLPLFFFAAIQAQAPSYGHIEAGTYKNSYFRFSYEWPKFLQPFNVASLVLPPKSPSNNEFLLFSARQGGEPYGIVVVAEKMNVPTAHTKGIQSEQQFMDWLIRGFQPEQQVTQQVRKSFKNADGTLFDELDYLENGAPSSVIVTQIGQFLVVFKCNAKSPADLAAMNQSIAALHRIQ